MTDTVDALRTALMLAEESLKNARDLLRLRDDAREVLSDIEWGGSEVHFICPWCKTNKQSGHQVTCKLDGLLISVSR